MIVPDLSQTPDSLLFILAIGLALITTAVLITVIDPLWNLFKWIVLFILKVTGIYFLSLVILKLLKKVRERLNA